jgi:hypothetical protein
MKATGRGILLGALVDAFLGLLVGVLLHAILSSDAGYASYEIPAGLLGIIFGAILGAFYGGALKLPRDEDG